MTTPSGKIALVTGAGSGIGRATALALLREGYSVVLAGRRADALERTAAEAGTAGSRALAVSDRRERPRLCAGAVRPDEGGLRPARPAVQQRRRRRPAVPLEDLTFEQWRRVIDVNLTGAFFCTQAAFRLMKEQTPRGGRIINNGSISAHVPRPQLRAVHGHQARHHRPDPLHRPGRPQIRHRLRPDRHRQRRDRDDGPDERRRPPGERRAPPPSRRWTSSTSPAPCCTWPACLSTRTYCS